MVEKNNSTESIANEQLLRQLLDEEKMAKLRCISDIMLHAQPTDAFSASVQECLYCGAIVFNGAWLVYNELDEIDARLVPFSDYHQLEQLHQYLHECR